MPNFPTFPVLRTGDTTGQAAPGSSRTHKPAVLTAKFGGRYSQRTGDGINAQPRMFNYKSGLLSPAKIKLVDDFLKGRLGYLPFLYLVPGETDLRQFTCETWTTDYTTPLLWSISGVFEENFDP